MTELQRLIKEQKEDASHFYVSAFNENETLIRPHVPRFQDFAGDTPKEKAFSVLRYLGWNHHDIVEALSLTIYQIIAMQDLLNTTYKPENYQRFYVDIPCKERGKTKRLSVQKQKAVLILRGLWWTGKDIASATDISMRSFQNLVKGKRIVSRQCASQSEHFFCQRVFMKSYERK